MKKKLDQKEEFNTNKLNINCNALASLSFSNLRSINSNRNAISSNYGGKPSNSFSPKLITPTYVDDFGYLLPPKALTKAIKRSKNQDKSMTGSKKYSETYYPYCVEMSQSPEKGIASVLKPINTKNSSSPYRKYTLGTDEENALGRKSLHHDMSRKSSTAREKSEKRIRLRKELYDTDKIQVN